MASLRSLTLNIVAIICWVVSIALSFVASWNYGVVVGLALISATLHFWAVAECLRTATSRLRFGLVPLAIVLVVVTIDNFGRLLIAAGGPSFRILI